MQTNYYKRLHEMYENTAEKFEVEHLTGYNKGGFGAYTLGEMVKTPTTLFNPSISFGNHQGIITRYYSFSVPHELAWYGRSTSGAGGVTGAVRPSSKS